LQRSVAGDGMTYSDVEKPTEAGTDHVVAMVPYYLKLGGKLVDVPLDQLDWPIGRPPGLTGQKVGDLDASAHIYTFPRRWVFSGKLRGLKAQLSLLLVEPKSFHWHYMWLAKLFHRRFYRVLTCNPDLLAAIPNGAFFVFGDTWVPDWRNKDVTKTEMASLIASDRRRLKGHKLRHKIVKRVRAEGLDVDIMGRGYRFFEDKAEGLAPYRYSVVIENSREPGYFTEKLIDAFLLNTVPIYWGAPDIATFFDPNGMWICESEDQIMAAIGEMSKADYPDKLLAIAANHETAQLYVSMNERAARLIEASL
jgi:hypothetical protein